MKKNKKELLKIVFVLFCGIILGGLITTWRFSQTTNYINNFFSSLEEKYFRMEEISHILEREYYDNDTLSWKNEEMVENAIKAYVDWLWDPYTSYLDKEQYSWLQTELEWEDSIEWIGAVVWKKDYYVQVEEIVKWSPAYNAWILPLDRIIMIWTWETKDLTVTEAVQKIRWPKGTIVDLFIERVDKKWQKEYLEIPITRDVIDIPSVKYKILEYEWVKFWYIEVTTFWDQTNKLFTHAISDVISEKVKGIIIDLRWNGWGLLTSAVQLAWHFIPKWDLVVKTKYKIFQDIDYYSKWYWELENLPTVILVDGLSASSSEILALALKEKQGAIVVWKQTFWKWTIQTLYDFDDGTSLKYTVWKRFSPSWISIDKEWIFPDIEESVDLTWYLEKWIDSQLQKAQEILFEKIK